MGKMGEHLFLKLRPTSSRYHGYFYNAEKVAEQPRHFGIERRLAFGQCTVQIEHDQLLHSGISISNTLTGPRGRKVHVPATAGNRNTSPFRDGISGAAVLHLAGALDTHQHARYSRACQR